MTGLESIARSAVDGNNFVLPHFRDPLVRGNDAALDRLLRRVWDVGRECRAGRDHQAISAVDFLSRLFYFNGADLAESERSRLAKVNRFVAQNFPALGVHQR